MSVYFFPLPFPPPQLRKHGNVRGTSAADAEWDGGGFWTTTAMKSVGGDDEECEAGSLRSTFTLLIQDVEDEGSAPLDQ